MMVQRLKHGQKRLISKQQALQEEANTQLICHAAPQQVIILSPDTSVFIYHCAALNTDLWFRSGVKG